MAKFKNDKGLTLIELLITIAVLAVVSAIALPVINNVVSSSNSNALNQTIKDANDFINKYSKSGVVAYDGLTRTLQGYVDTDGDNQIDSNELIDTLTLDAKYSVTPDGSTQVGSSYSSGGVVGVSILTSTVSGTQPTPTTTPGPIAPAGTTYVAGSPSLTSDLFMPWGAVWTGGGNNDGGPGILMTIVKNSTDPINANSTNTVLYSGLLNAGQVTITVTDGNNSVSYPYTFVETMTMAGHLGFEMSPAAQGSLRTEIQQKFPAYGYNVNTMIWDAATNSLTINVSAQ